MVIIPIVTVVKPIRIQIKFNRLIKLCLMKMLLLLSTLIYHSSTNSKGNRPNRKYTVKSSKIVLILILQ